MTRLQPAMTGLPLIPDLQPGESLASHVERTKVMNGLPGRLELHRHLVATGLDEGVAADATIGRYPPSVVGRGGQRRAIARTWRLPAAVRWRCPTCTPASGVWMRDWAMACHPICTTCGTLLTKGDNGEVTRVESSALQWQRDVAGLLESAVTRLSARSRVSAAYRLATLIALTLDEAWPTPHARGELELRAAVLARGLHRSWFSRVATEPAQALVVARHAFAVGDECDRLVAQGWDRVCETTAWRDFADAPPPWLPRLPSRVLIAPTRRTPTGADEGALRRVVGAAWAAGLRSEHVPGMLLRAGERLLPAPGEVPVRGVLAVVLHAQLRSRTPGRSDYVASALELEARGAVSSLILRHLLEGRGLHPRYVTVLADAAAGLRADGLIDRTGLRRRMAGRLLRPCGLTRALQRVAPQHGDVELGEWAWVDATGSLPPGTAPAGVQRVRRLDASLDPEVRWQLRRAVESEAELADLASVLAAEESGSQPAQLWGVR